MSWPSSFNPGLYGGGAPAPVNYGWNFRDTLAGPTGFAGDVSPDVFVTDETVGLAGPAGVFGFLNGGGSAGSNGSATYGSKAAGQCALNNAIDAYFTTGAIANGNYKLRLGAGVDFISAATSLALWNGYCGETSNLLNDPYTTSGAATAGRVVITTAGRLYFVVTGGTMAATAPTDETGNSFASGTATLRYIKTAVFFVNAPTPANPFVDGSGGSHTPTNWQTNNLLSSTFGITAGFAILSRLTSQTNYPRHVGLLGQ